jgi:hypothetical protein
LGKRGAGGARSIAQAVGTDFCGGVVAHNPHFAAFMESWQNAGADFSVLVACARPFTCVAAFPGHTNWGGSLPLAILPNTEFRQNLRIFFRKCARFNKNSGFMLSVVG